MAKPAGARERLASEANPRGLVSSHNISLDVPQIDEHERPPAVKQMSLPAYHSPLRHHRRTSSRTQHVKETLNAHSHHGSSSDDGTAVHRVNQYIIKQEIGRGSFGAVHLAVDQYGTEFAVKEFSKSRLRKRAQSNLLRGPGAKRPSGHLAAGVGFNSPLHRHSPSENEERDPNNALDLIKEEIAIMKKLDHNNLVSLIEVLDDPEEDSLYMVLEMCKKGVAMKVGLEDVADPYDEEVCRCWFRDMILGIEYLHAQGIIHRDIKPDNCLITNDDVLKIVDFGVSEMFEKQSDMSTAKSAGSPAFMPPELCVARHGQVSGRAADIWSMGVTLYCLRYGRIPFERHGVLELYESIRKEELQLPGEQDERFADLMSRILEKDPDKRINMHDLRNHPWVTKKGEDPLLPTEENCADIVEPPTEDEMKHAITGNMVHLLVVMKAVKRFKNLLSRKRPEMLDGVFDSSLRMVNPPHSIRSSKEIRQTRSADGHDRKPLERALTAEGIHHGLDVSNELVVSPTATTRDPDTEPNTTTRGPPSRAHREGRVAQEKETSSHQPDVHRSSTFPAYDHQKGHAHDPLTDTLFLDIGAGPASPTAPPGAHEVLSESPSGVEIDVYELAYKEEMKKILERRGKSVSLYPTRRVDHLEDIRKHENVISHDASRGGMGAGSLSGFAGLVARAKEKASGDAENNSTEESEVA